MAEARREDDLTAITAKCDALNDSITAQQNELRINVGPSAIVDRQSRLCRC